MNCAKLSRAIFRFEFIDIHVSMARIVRRDGKTFCGAKVSKSRCHFSYKGECKEIREVDKEDFAGRILDDVWTGDFLARGSDPSFFGRTNSAELLTALKVLDV